MDRAGDGEHVLALLVAMRAVISEPLDNAASTTRQPRVMPLIRRLRRGKFAASGGVPRGNSEIERAFLGDGVRQIAIARRIHFIEPGADDRDASKTLPPVRRDARRRRCPAPGR